MNDPYLYSNTALNRLLEEYKKYGKLIVALDFDDTIFDFHKKGHTYTQVIELIQRAQGLGFFIVIFTGSPKEKYPEILEYCKSVGITPTGINQNPFPMPFGNDGKIYFNILLDDRAGLQEAFMTLREVVNYATQHPYKA